jgi:subtilisin family serine protease
LNNKNRNNFEGKYREINELSKLENQGATLSEDFKKNYLSEEYENYILYYFGNIEDAFKKVDYANVYSIGPLFTMATVKKGMLDSLLEDIPEIYYAEKSYPFTLSGLERLKTLTEFKLINKESSTLNGDSVIVGIIGAGIDYLNERFTDDAKKTRIVAIWDQTIEGGKVPPSPLFYGSEFLKADINNAMNTKALGKDPYSIVNHRDETGYGTAIAGIIGGRKLYPEDPFISVAPKCEYAIVKLKEAKKSTLAMNMVDVTEVPVYETTDIRTAIIYLTELQLRENKPMVIYLPLGTNIGGHDGASPIENFIDFFSDRRGLAFVSDTGSQGDTETHTSGVLRYTGDVQTIEINIDPNQRNFYTSIWCTRPDKVSIGIVSPAGDTVERIPPLLLNGEFIYYDIGESKVSIQFYLSTTNGIEFVNIYIKDITSGVWKINLIGDYIVEGRYDAWTLQRELLHPETKFLDPDPFITLTLPSTANNALTNSYFDTKTDVVTASSGRGFTKDGRIKPEVSSPGTDILTTSPNGENITVSGAGAGGAVLAGAIAWILQWGIVNGNDKKLYAPKIKTYLVRSVVRKPNVQYPNPEYGYGMLSLDKLIESLQTRHVHYR